MFKLICPLFLFIFVSLAGQESEKKEITIYLDKGRGFFNYTTESNEQRGIFPKLIEQLKRDEALDFDTIELSKDEFEHSIDKGIPDIVMGVEDYKRNDEEYYYLDKPLELDGVMITRKDFPNIDSDFNFFDKRIVFVEGDKILSKTLKKYKGQINYTSKPTIAEAMNSLLTGESDIYVEDLQDALKYLGDHQSLKGGNGLRLNYLSGPLKTKYYIGGKKKYREIVDKLGSLMGQMDLGKPFFFREFIEYTEDKIEFHREIEDYIQSNNVIKIFIPKDSNLYPMYYKESSGKVAGFLVDYFSEISKVLGISMIFEVSNNSRESDINPLILSINDEEIESEAYLTTEPYYNYSIFLFNRLEDSYISCNEELSNYRIAVTKNSIEERYFIYKGMEDNLMPSPSYLEGINAVSKGRADIFAGSIKRTNDTLMKNNIKTLKVMGDIDDRISLKMGILKEKELLYFIINSFDKTFAYLIPEKTREILEKQIEITKDYKVSILITLLSIVGFYGLWRHFRKLKNIHGKLKKITFGLVETLESANTYNDEDTGDHVKRINSYSTLLAEKLKMSNTFINEIGTYASLHDIGKIGISDLILKKPGKLTHEEFEEMKKHSEIGYKMIKNLGVGAIATNIIRYHHEKWDGTGYPKQLAGKDIPLEARIVALADVYDALRQERVYKKAFDHEKAVEIISSLSGKHFDPQLVEIFLKVHLDFKSIFERSTLESNLKKRGSYFKIN